MKNLHEVLEIKYWDFECIKDIIFESKLIDDQLLNLEDAIWFIKDKLRRNKAKVFITKNSNIPVAFTILYYKGSTSSKLRYNWHISYLYVKPEFRGKKMGREIISTCIEYAKKTRVEHISLNATTDNYPAQQLYESIGFIRTNFISNYYYYEMKLLI